MQILNLRVANLRKDRFKSAFLFIQRKALLIIPFIIFLDQVFKARFASSCNSGIAFGALRSFGVFNVFVPVIVVLTCFYFLLRQERKFLVFALALIVGGGLSNILDRLVIGCVRDFIDFKFWPSFNLADSAVTIGIILLVFSMMFGEHERS